MTDEIAPASCGTTTCVTAPSVEHARDLAAQFNQSCFCITLDRNAMAGAMEIAAGDPAFYDTHILSRPHLFSNVPVFLPEADRAAMLAIVQAIEATTRIPGFREAVLAMLAVLSSTRSGPARNSPAAIRLSL